MTSPVEEVHAALPPDTGMRVGVVTAQTANNVIVAVGGQQITCGFVNQGQFTVGSPVAILRGAASWLALGGVAATAPPSDRVAFVAVATGVGSNATANYADVPGGNTFVTFTKLSPVTSLRIDLHLTFFTDSSLSGADFAVAVNGVDTLVSRLHANLSANVHQSVSGVLGLSGLAAGTWTIQARYKRVSGAGAIHFDADDWMSMAVTEVRP
jgi:hypothetical protein